MIGLEVKLIKGVLGMIPPKGQSLKPAQVQEVERSIRKVMYDYTKRNMLWSKGSIDEINFKGSG